MGHGLRPGDLKLPFDAAENWPTTNAFDNPGTRDNYHAGGHEGIDWGCCEGTPVRAMAAGRVSKVVTDRVRGGMDVPSNEVYGNHVRIRTGAEGTGFEHTYAHLAQVYVYAGQEVAQGQLLGLSGDTGRSSNPHLHVHLSPFGLAALTAGNPHGLLLHRNEHDPPKTQQSPRRIILGAVDFDRFLPVDRPVARDAATCPVAKGLASATALTVHLEPNGEATRLMAANLARLDSDDNIILYAVLGKDATPAAWWQISVPDVGVGWIRDAAVDVENKERVPITHPRHAALVAHKAVQDGSDGIEVQTASSAVNVRSAPEVRGQIGDDDHNVLGLLREPAGARAWRAVSRWACNHDEKEVWFEIALARGDLVNPVDAGAITGWIRADTVNDRVQPAEIQAATALAVRAWPDGPALDGVTLAAQQRYALIGQSFDGAWWQVRLAANRAGWVRQDAVTAQGYRNYVPVTWRPLARVKDGTAEDMSVRAGPEETQRVVATLNRDGTDWPEIWGQFSASPTWWLLRLRDGSRGWVRAADVQTTGHASAAPVMWPPQASLKSTVTLGLNVRSGPGASHRRVGSIAGGSTTKYEIVGKDATVPTWWRIQFSDALAGWVSAAHVQTHGEVSRVPAVSVAPTAVRHLAATVTGPTAVRVAWQPPAGAGQPTGYAVQYRRQGADAWTTQAHAGTRAETALTGLVAGTAYDVRVRAANAAGNGPWTTSQGTTAAAAQASLKPALTAGLSVRAGPDARQAQVGRLAGGATTRYAVVGKDAAVAAWWQIRFSATVTGWVPSASVRTHGSTSEVPVTILQAVRRLTAVADGARALRVTWQAPADGPAPTGYDVQYRQQDTHAWLTHTHVGTDVRATLRGLTQRATYEVQVRARQGTAQGPWTAGTGAAAAAPQLSLKATTTLGLNVRSGPDTSHGRVGSIPGGSATRYDILGKDAAAAAWWQIRFTPSLTGWVHGDYVQTHGSTSGVAVTWVLQAVRSLAVAAHGPRALNVTWQAPAGGPTPTGYDVQYRQQGANAWTNQAHSGAGATAALSGLTPKTTYEVQVRATRSAAQGPWTAAQGATAALPQLSLKTTTTLGLNVRSGPGTSHSRVGSIAGGSTAKYDILGQSGTSPVWWQIRFSDAVTGWVHGNYVQTHGSTSGVAVTWVLQAVRSLAVAAHGTRALNVTWQTPAGGPTPTGYDVQYRQQGANAWINQAHSGAGATAALSGLTPKTTYEVQVRATRSAAQGPWTAAQGATAALPQLSLKTTTTLGLNVRSGPGTGHSRVGSIAGGSTAKYDILGQDAASPVWWQIRFSDTVTGWVHGNYVQTHGSTSGVTVTWVLQTVRSLAVAAHGPRALNVTWQAPAGGPTPTGYDVQYRQQGANAWINQAHSGAGATAALSGLTPKTTYEVQVRATRSAAQGPWTAAQGATAALPQLSLKSTTTLGLNVRSGPGTSHSRVGSIAGGSTAKYDILGKDAVSPVWWQIRFSDAVTGWVHGNYVQTHGSTSGVAVTWVLQAVRSLAVAAHGPRALNVTWQAPAGGPTPTGYDVQYRQQGASAWTNQAHSGTGATAALSGLTPQTTYAVQVRATRSAAQGPWTAAQGATAASPQLSLKATTTLGLNVRSGPGTTYAVVGRIAGGATTKYDILGKDAASPVWWQIRFSNAVTGWVHGNYVQTHGRLSGVAVVAAPPQLSLKRTTTWGLNVRAGAGTGHRIVGTIAGGSTARYDILGKNAATPTWWQIRFSAAVTGWVHADYVQTHGSTSNVPRR